MASWVHPIEAVWRLNSIPGFILSTQSLKFFRRQTWSYSNKTVPAKPDTFSFPTAQEQQKQNLTLQFLKQIPTFPFWRFLILQGRGYSQNCPHLWPWAEDMMLSTGKGRAGPIFLRN